MIIKDRHNRLFLFFFQSLFWVLSRFHFRKVNIVNELNLGKGPVLLIANHFSWWDGFFAQKVNRKILKRRFHVMMLEEELKKRRFLSKTGAFSIRKGHRNALESIEYAAGIMNRDENMLLLFPQGRFQSTHRYPLRFYNGWGRILEQTNNTPQVIFMACLSDYFENRKPTVNIYLEKAFKLNGESKKTPDAAKIEDEYNEFLKRAIDLQDKR